MSMLRVELSLPEWVEREVDFTRSYGTPESRMQLAIELARSNIRHDSGGPFGAAIFRDDGQLLAVGVNRVVPQNCSAAHDCRRVVDAITNHGHLVLLAQLADGLNLVLGHQVAPSVGEADLAGDRFGNELVITREHDRPPDADGV